MSNPNQTVLASRPAALVLALTLVAGLTAPFVMLPTVQAAATPLPCTENNHNGCTELSPTPPEDTVSVPANIVLMFDDSGSMSWDVMPDWDYLPAPNWNNLSANWSFLDPNSVEPLIDSDINGVYYNPTVTYTLPPKADSTLYPNATFDAALINGFDTASAKVDLSLYRGRYDSNDPNYEASSVQYSITVAKVGATAYTANTSCPTGWSGSGKYPGYCYQTNYPGTDYIFYDTTNHDYYTGKCNSITDAYDATAKTCKPGISFFTYTTTNPMGGYIRHYVAKNTGDCAAAGLSSTVCDESAATRQNVANWFSYYHTRILMAKSGLMTAFDRLNPDYRFGFGSINGGAANWITKNISDVYGFSTSTNGNNKLAEVQPFGDGTAGSRKAQFWDWIVTESPGNSTPLRGALQGVGNYYRTQQPWQNMSSDPGWVTGGTTKFACRASYTILTTDGFWNGANPGVGNVDNAAGPVYSPPAGKTYTVTGYTVADPYKDANSNTLADVAMYYWANDLQDGTGGSYNLANELAPSTADPAFWQHMTTFTMGLGFVPTNISGTDAGGNPVTIPEIFAWAQGGSAITGFGWPAPSSDSINNIADLAHAAVNGHGDFFSAKSPQDLAKGFAKAIADINARNVPPTPAGVNASVLAIGAQAFETGYNTGDWSGVLQSETLKTDGTTGTLLWNAASILNTDFHSSSYTSRAVYTDAYTLTAGVGSFSSFQFTAANKANLDSSETAGLGAPAYAGGVDTIDNRIGYLLGSDANEGTIYRTRSSLLGAIIRSAPLYVANATGNYYDSWPTFGGIAPPEAASGAQPYDTFASNQATRKAVVYVGANDGMLHAFYAPVPTCSGTIDVYGNCTAYTFSAGSNEGKEAWAFVPRAVYANLGNLTSATGFAYRPTVDGAPVTRDVYFSQNGNHEWHTILAGGVGLGGRGVYALDITSPASFSASDVLWEFDSDMSSLETGCTASYGSCKASDLGYTVSQPNIGRLSNGKWVVLVPNGYFPDCTTPDFPTADAASCNSVAQQAPKDTSGNPYSALFVMDAQTGAMIAELKTPTNLGVTSFGLATPVLGDYNSDQVDDVAFAGDVQGNLWRFDLSDTNPSGWTVTLVYKGKFESGHQGVQPITTMPRLFPDASTNRFMVVFGTGKFLGIGDNSNNEVQTLYGVRDVVGTTYTQADLTEQFLHEYVVPTGQPNAGASLRCVTGDATNTCAATATPANAIPASGAGSGGWFINLYTTTSGGVQNDAGERVLVNPGAIFASNTVIFETLITGSQSSDPCSPSTQGSILALNAGTGGAAGVSSLGGWPIVGGRINNARTSGSLPIVSALGGGQAYLPGVTLAPSGSGPLSIDTPIWRRRSWNEINQNQ